MSPRHHRRLLRSLTASAAALVLGAALTACSSGDDDVAAPTGAVTTVSGTAAPSATSPSGTVTPGTAQQSTVATTEQPGSTATFSTQVIETPSSLLTTVATTPAGYTTSPTSTAIVAQALPPAVPVFEQVGDTKPFTTLKNPLPSGAPLTFLVDGQTPTRAKVLLPMRPNGRTGWVDLSAIRQVRNDYKLVVQLAEFRIEAFKGSEVILDTKIGVGTEETPTPGGRYYIKELLRPPNPDTVYGVYAYGLSGFSPNLNLRNFNGGEGVLGIHGTNRPDLLGQRISHGCIRMRNEDITKLAKLLPLGTPVIVQP